MTTAKHTWEAEITGASEGGTDLINLQVTNTSAVYAIQHTTLTTNAITGATTISVLSSGVRQVYIVPPSTNLIPMRLGASTGDTTAHISLHHSDPTIVSVTTLSTLVLWTTGSSAISGIRIIQC